jgi:Immunity protein 27
MPFPAELNDIWVLRDGKMVAEGDAKAIDALLETSLVELKTANWAILYRHKDTAELWQLVYPQSEMHGGGPRRLRRLDQGDPENWHPN